MACVEFRAMFATGAASTTAKSMIGVKAAANHPVRVDGFYACFDGVDAADNPCLIEVCTATFATNSPGTNSTSVTPAKTQPDIDATIQATAAKLWSSEPTVLTAVDIFNIPVYHGAALVFYPLKKSLIIPGGTGCVVRVTLAAATVGNMSGGLLCEE